MNRSVYYLGSLRNKGLFLKALLAIMFFLIFALRAQVSQKMTPLGEKLRTLPEAEIVAITPDSAFSEAYEIRLKQPLDHFTGGTPFSQKIYLSHCGFDRPVVLVTAGYGVRKNFISEVTRLLRANQILVEHRYFGDSRPDSLDWRFLNIRQAAADHHRIVRLFRRIYPGKWVSTGRSKGGQTALFFKRFYSQDVDATVAFVAPLNLSDADPRIDYFIRNAGSPECRRKMEVFQWQVLAQRDSILPLLAEYAREKNIRFSIGLPAVLEFAVLEYPFSFWQWAGLPPDSIPAADATPEKLFRHLTKVVGLRGVYSDRGIKNLEPAFYQFFTELGYYGFSYNSRRVRNKLTVLRHPSNIYFLPKDVTPRFHPEVMADVRSWLQYHGNHIIYIYGEQDPWGATGIQLIGRTDALKLVQKAGNHRACLKTLSESQRSEVEAALQKWLGIPIPGF